MRSIHRITIGTLLIAALMNAVAQDGSLDLTFNPGDAGYGSGDGMDSYVYSMALQPDGKVLLGGNFTLFDSKSRPRIARANLDGSVDLSFVPGAGPNNVVRAIALQADGRILIGGDFTTCSGITRNRIARLNSDGTLDTSFDPVGGANGTVRAIVIQPDGRIIVAGSFTTCNSVTSNHLARLNADGSLDAGFSGTFANGDVLGLALQPDGKLLAAGSFTQMNSITRNRIARLNSNGSLDATFDPGTGASATVNAIALQGDGKVIIGGAFNSVASTTRNRLARLGSTGALDASFDPGTGPLGTVMCIVMRTDGKAIVAGALSQWNGQPRYLIARVNPDGTLDASFASATTNSNICYAAVLRADNRMVLGGTFQTFNNATAGYFCQVFADGDRDGSFDHASGMNGWVLRIRPQPDGKLIVIGNYSGFNGNYRGRIMRMLADGSEDPTFNAGIGPDWNVYDCAVQTDGRIIIGGRFSTVSGASRNRIARLNVDGSLDPTFDPGTGFGLDGVFDYYGYVNAVALQADGKILVGGTFERYNGSSVYALARLNSDGSLDTPFTNGIGGGIYDLAVQPDGKILGAHSGVNRVNPDGSPDGTFSYTGPAVDRLCLAPDGKIYVSGNGCRRLHPNGSIDSTFVWGGNAGWVRRLELLPDGKVLVGGEFTSYNGIPRSGIARLNADGSLDTSFDPGTGLFGGAMWASYAQPDGKILIGGGFTGYNGTGRNRIARINGTPRTSIRLMLEGPYSNGQMNDALRALPSFPLTEPFSALGYANGTFTSGASISASVLSTSGNNAIVDWVIVEMRPAATPNVIAASRAVLLQRDGDVVDLDGVSSVGFAGLTPGNYCVAVRSRNHLPVMLSVTTPIAYGTGVPSADFTLPTTQVYDNDARKNMNGVMVLAAGDVSFNGTVSYTGANNDRDPILVRVGGTSPNNTVSGYYREDANMDGTVKYTGANNDRDVILTNVGATTPANTRVASLP